MSTTVDPKGKVALVTGSSSGIGLEAVRALAKRGVNVILTGSRDKSLVTDLLDEIRSYGVRADYVSSDLSKSSNVNSLWTEVLKLYSDGIDILVNNAGCGYIGPVEEIPDEEFDRTVAVNLTAMFILTKSCLPDMKRKGWGRIINVSSVLGSVGAPDSSGYLATKHAMNGFTKGVALETATQGITFLELAVKYGQTMGLSREQVMAENAAQNETGTWIQAEQVAEVIEFLCFSGASSQMTGADYLIDSGYSAK